MASRWFAHRVLVLVSVLVDMRVCSVEAEIGYVRVAYIGVEKWDNWSVKRSVPF